MTFYLENIDLNSKWKIKIISYCNVDIDKFKRLLVLKLKGYKVE
ncbi:MAG: hypothetical protein SPK04_01510 [Succinivibrionaceae bacterium]|nr:hypothetical protein [Succinivibrionaceae bacterium]